VPTITGKSEIKRVGASGIIKLDDNTYLLAVHIYDVRQGEKLSHILRSILVDA